MRRISGAVFGLLFVFGLSELFPSESRVSADVAVTEADHPEMEFAIGGCGGAYFLAAPGEFVVDVYKRDRNLRGRTTELRAILVGPDRQVLQEATIPDDARPRGSGLGPIQHVRLATNVTRKGIFALNITVSQDRYGEEMIWGFRTNCPQYLIETSRGHRDERRQEPIVLLNPDRPGDVCFVPRMDRFGIEVTGLPKSVRELTLFDSEDHALGTLPVDDRGSANQMFPANEHRESIPWRLHLPVQQARIQIDGVTRWSDRDRYVNLPCWTPNRTSYFPLLSYRWLLTPYHRTIHGNPNEAGHTSFRVHNNGFRKTTVGLSIEFPADPWPVQLSSERIELEPGQSSELTVDYVLPAAEEDRVCHLRATPIEGSGFSTYSTLTVKASQPAASKPIDIPIVLKPYEHENEQFGYLPDYPAENQIYFDAENRPCTRSRGGVATYHDRQWRIADMRTAINHYDPELSSRAVGLSSSKIAFDRDNDMYVLATAGRQAVLLHSADLGATFSAYAIPGRENQSWTFDIEQFSGHNIPDGPPPIVRFTRTATDSKLRWRRVNDLELILPRKEDGRVTFDAPILISDNCIGLSAHSGIPSSVVSRDSKVHVAWGAATDPEEKVPGVPAYVVTYDRQSKRLGEPALIGYGPPANDVHNSPSITMDSKGYLHVVAGTHGQPFPYARSLAVNDSGAGWTKAVPVGDGQQTYVGFVCGADDTLHLVFRMWRRGVEPYPASHHATLAYQRKRIGQPWEKPRVLVVSPFSEYSIFYHRLTVDRRGRLFLSYDYWSTYWFYRTDHYGDRRAVTMSADDGNTWKLVETSDL